MKYTQRNPHLEDPADTQRGDGWMRRLVRRLVEVWNSPYAYARNCPRQLEVNRLRRVLHEIADSRPDQHMDIEKNPELVNWICETCHKASVGAYPPNDTALAPPPQRLASKKDVPGG